MGRRLTITWLFIVFTLVSSACRISGGDKRVDSDLGLAMQEDIYNLSVLYNAQSIPQHFFDENAERSGEEFDPNKVFEILDHLAMEEGYTLDYVYDPNPMGGYPLLYARKNNQPRFINLADYENAYPECLVNRPPDSCFYLNHVTVDGSEAGFVQLLVMYRMGDQFYLDWHANYNDAEVVTSIAGLEKIINERSNTSFGAQFTRSQQAKASDLEPRPVVEIGESTVKVKITWFTKWGGFYASTYEVQRDMPHRVKMVETINLLEYECDIMF